jgi:hypothetical protein
MRPSVFGAILWSYPITFVLVSLAANSYDALHKFEELPTKASDRRRVVRANKTLLVLHSILAFIFVRHLIIFA